MKYINSIFFSIFFVFVIYFGVSGLPCYGQGCVPTGIENGVEVTESSCAHSIFLRIPGDPDLFRPASVLLDLSVDPSSLCAIDIHVDPLFGCPIGHVGKVFTCFVDNAEDVPCPRIDVTFDKDSSTVTVIFDATTIDTDEPTGFAGNLRLPIGAAAGIETLFLEVFIDVYVGDTSQFREPIIPGPATPTPTPTPSHDLPDSDGHVDPCFPNQDEFCQVPMATDVSFVKDSDVSFNSRTFRGFSFTFDIEVTRAVDDVQRLITTELIGKEGTLSIVAYDVDTNIPNNIAALGIEPETDAVLFNGNLIGFLSGSNEKWEKSTFVFPVEFINFPSIGINGQRPIPAKNTVEILVDIGNEGNFVEELGTDAFWSVAVDQAQLTIQTVSPIILVHGNNSKGAFYEEQGFTLPLEVMGWPFDNSISMPTESIIDHSRRLRTLIPERVRQFGVDSIHIVAHSKGGLDTRDYLQRYYDPSVFKVLSLTTLSTPHLGAAGPDFQLARASEIFIDQLGGTVETLGFLDAVAGVDAGTLELTTKSVAAFNERNMEVLANLETEFQNFGGDADKNRSGDIDIQSEIDALIIEYPSLDNVLITIPDIVTPDVLFNRFTIVNEMYHLAKNFRSVELTKTVIGGVTVWENAVAIPGGGPNDTAVTMESANAFGATIKNFTGGEGRNHADIADERVAEDWVIPTLKIIEITKGDLRPEQ